ncbi:MAG: DNA-directed DNA polymerase II small subunit [Thermoplasmata archaeon]|nr:DNA-directed DNA polymerase II small subunit [Thermoplasmata archaeon]
MREHLVAYFESHRKLVESSALQLILTSPQPLDLSRALIDSAGTESPFVTHAMVVEMMAQRAPASSRAPAPAPVAPPPYALVSEGYSTPAAGRGPLEAYGELFASRFATLSRMLRGRPELANVRPIHDLARAEGRAAVIGMVRDVRQTPEKHHILLTLEDASGSIELLAPRGTEAARTPFLPDEVVGVVVQVGRERDRLSRVLSAHRPDVTTPRTPRRTATPERVAFLSDLHIGSKSFLAEEWASFVEFLHGRGPDPALAAEIRQVVIAGDLVDGIGIYPNQERDLAIGDVLEQYAELARRLRELPARMEIVVVPGNHDAVCPAEPQPGLPPEIRSSLPENVHSISNPSTFALGGVVVTAYHGRSFDDLIPAIPGASYARPTEVMKRMLTMRHLAPMYGGRTPLAPLARDGLVIDPSPDILVTGHAHTYGIDQYRGVLLLNASTWQAETDYQKMRNISPVPAHCAVVDLSDLTVTTVDCTEGRVVLRTGA